MYKNQYIIVPHGTEIASLDLHIFDFGELQIYAHNNLNITIVKGAKSEVALLGYIIDPLSPDKMNNDIISSIADNCSTVYGFFETIEQMTGRYVLLYKNDTSFIVVGDACHLRQIYYGFTDNIPVLTSSPKLFLDVFKYELQTTHEKLKLINNQIYIRNESAWYGDESLDSRLKKLLPNHYYDIRRNEKNRRPYFSHNFRSEKKLFEHASTILRQTYSALVKRYKLMHALTSGWDSRILLASSRDFKDIIQYYVFEKSSGNFPDTLIPGNLSRKLNFKFKVFQTSRLRDGFISEFGQEHIIPRVLPKTADIQHHFDCNYESDVINVSGNCGGLIKCFWGYTKGKVSLDMLVTFAESTNRMKVPYFKKQLEKWYPEAKKYAEDHKIPLLDLFYWEQRMGNWGALWFFEQDIAIEVVEPFNNRSLLTSLIEIGPEKRRSPNYTYQRKLIQYLWEDTLSEPINPGGNYFKKVIKGHALLKYSIVKFKSIFIY